MEENFTSIEDLCENVERGGEIEFMYKDRKFSITHSDEGIHLMEFYNYSSEKVFKSASEIGEYIIGKKKLKDIITEMNITFRCF